MAVNQKLPNTSNSSSLSIHGPRVGRFAMYCVDLARVEAALRQQRAGNGREGQQEQQHQRGAHAE